MKLHLLELQVDLLLFSLYTLEQTIPDLKSEI